MLAPGWRGGAERARPWVEGLRRRGFEAEAVLLPLAAEVACERFLEVATPGDVVAGVSFGGRVASLAAARAPFRGLLCFSYPLRDRGAERTAHWPGITCPTLLVSGDADPWAPAEELKSRLELLPNGRLELIEGAGHSPDPELALEKAVPFLSTLRP